MKMRGQKEQIQYMKMGPIVGRRTCSEYVVYPACVSVCVSVCVCPANILVFYFSAIRRDIDLKFIQDTYRVVPNSPKTIDLYMSKVKVTGTVPCFLKVSSHDTEP